MKKTADLPFGNLVSSTELFENRHWKLEVLHTAEYHNALIQVSDVSDIHCRRGGERPLQSSEPNVYWTFILVLEGKGKMTGRRSVREFKAGAVLALPPGQDVAFSVLDEPFHVYRFLIQDSGALRDLFSQDVPECSVLLPSAPELLLQSFQRTFQLMNQQNERTPLLVSAEAFVFLSELKRQCAAGALSGSFRQVCNEISCFPTRHYTLNALAAACRMSVRTFQRRFVKEFHCPPRTFIMICRLTIARRILRSSLLSVQEIAQRCRFDSTAQFSKSFRKYIGMSPREYRKRFSCEEAEYYQTDREKNGFNFWGLLPGDTLSPLRRQILWCLIENRHATPRGIASLLHAKVSAVREEMRELRETGVF